jgi:hypothetical protein
MAITPINTPPVQPGSSTQAPTSPAAASTGTVDQFKQALHAGPKNPRDMTEDELVNEIRQLNTKAAVYPGLSEDEQLRRTQLTSEQSDRSRRRPGPRDEAPAPAPSATPGASILKNL